MSTSTNEDRSGAARPLPRRTVGGGVASGAASPQLPPAGGRSPFAASSSFAASSPPHFPLHASGLMNATAAAGGAGTTNASSTSSPFIRAAVSSSSSSSLLGSPLSAGSSGGGSRIALLSQEENQELQRVGSGDGDDDEGPEEQEEDEEDGIADGAFLALPPSAHPGGGASGSLARSSSSHSLQMVGGSGGGNSGGGRGKRDVSVPLLVTQVLRQRPLRVFALPDPRARYVMFKQNIGSTSNDLTEQDLQLLAQETEGFSGSDISVLVRDALYEPVRIAQIATHFKPVSDPSGVERQLWEPCSSGDKAAKEMSLYDLPAGTLKPLDTTIAHFEHAVRSTKPSVGPEDLGRFEEWTTQYGQEGSG